MTPRRPLPPLTPIALFCLLGLAPLAAQATNGMNMEGYGPISTGLGGASQAIDHGTAALAQNPATLGLMTGPARLDLALGVLGPKVASSIPGGPSADSGGTSYVMPGVGYVRRSGAFVWGVGMFAQGGMGTEYDAASFLAAGSGQPVRSELSVGRVLLPLVWKPSSDFMVGGTLDYVWAGLDLKMAAPFAQLAGLVTGGNGNLAAGLQGIAQSKTPPAWGRIDFSNDNDFTGKATASGWAAKLGLVWKATPAVTVGASYQFTTSLDDLETDATGATLGMQGMPALPGKITVVDFQWPSMIAFGVAWQASPAFLWTMDVKRIGWKDVMKDFRMRFDSADTGQFSGSVSFALPQNWKDQTVTSLGVAYTLNPEITLRGGVNLAANPIPETFVNPLFPATVKTHYTAGLGWKFGATSEFNAALTVAPESKVTNGDGIVVTHKQTNAQLMYSYRF